MRSSLLKLQNCSVLCQKNVVPSEIKKTQKSAIFFYDSSTLLRRKKLTILQEILGMFFNLITDTNNEQMLHLFNFFHRKGLRLKPYLIFWNFLDLNEAVTYDSCN